eukprot:gene32645-39469_t
MKRSSNEVENSAELSKDEVNNDPMRPQKRFFRSRAHCNPLSHNDSFAYPLNPSLVPWEEVYPNIPESQRVVKILDMGMGFGGLTVKLAELFPTTLVLGMEIRAKVCEYVRLRIEALRHQHSGRMFENAGCLRTNCMRYLPHYFQKGQLDKMFICFPDPHFKAKNHRRRIVTPELLSEYAYFIRPGGRLYTITDVEELYHWHVAKLDAHPYFQRVSDEQLAADPCLAAMSEDTEESKKVGRMGGRKFAAVYERREDGAQRCDRAPHVLELWA